MNDPVKRWEHAYGNALVSGTVASITSTVALSMLGKAELDRSAAPLNGPSQWIWGRHAPYQNRFSFRYTVVGYLIHHAASVFWAIWYEKLRQRLPPADNAIAVVAPAAVITTDRVRRRLSLHSTATHARIRAPPLESIAAYRLRSVRSRLGGNSITWPLLKIP